MHLRFLLLALAASLLLAAAPAAAVTIQLSEMGSEDEERDECLDPDPDTCGTDPAALDAFVTFEIGEFDGANSGDEIRITVQNTSAYDITDVWLNLSSDISVTSILSPGDTGADDGFDLDTNATVPGGASLGSYNLGLIVDSDINLNDDLIESGETHQIVLAFTCSGTTCDEDDLVVNGEGKLVLAKFQNGGQVFEEADDPLGNDSAFGASGTGSIVPEPAAAWLLGLGLAGLAVASRKRA